MLRAMHDGSENSSMRRISSLWSKQQADSVARCAHVAARTRQLDWENLAEEIEDLGKSLRLALRSQICRIIQHQVKLEHSPAIDPRSGWRRRSDMQELR